LDPDSGHTMKHGGRPRHQRNHPHSKIFSDLLEQLATHPALDRTPDEETEAAYPDVIGGLSLALAQSFKILHPDLKNPQTQHWDEARALFDLLL
ncbi:DUF1931 family protein, partial [Streptomyces sp. NPDC001156]